MSNKKRAEYPLSFSNPDLVKEWDCDKNMPITSNDVSSGSGLRVWWKCSSGHEWQAIIQSRVKGSGCPYCAGRKALKGFNDLQTLNPHLSSEWNYGKNGDLTPADVTLNSNKKVWWKCSKGHEWLAAIYSRQKGTGCPYCSGRFAIKGKNDLQTLNPSISAEWNYEKNGDLLPSDFMANSGKRVWWKCSKGHEWQATISHRNNGRGCPYCSGQRLMKGVNDLQTLRPDLSREWNYEKNGELMPDKVTTNNGKKVWWKCYKGHEWQAKIYHRNNGSNCPICYSERNTSLPEYMIMYYLNKAQIDIIHSYKENGYEVDIYIPQGKIGIEYDGYFWHKEKREADLEKNSQCNADGIKLYRIREGLPSLNDTSIDFVIQKDNRAELSQAIEKLVSCIIGLNVDVDLVRDAIAIENMRDYIEKDKSIFFTNPELSKEWNYERNGNLKPEFFTSNSGKKVWWKCKNGHEWQAVIQNRSKGIGCPYCAGRVAIKGINDLQTVNPTLSSQWDYDKNDNLTPSDVLPNSEKSVWWVCSKGHEYRSMVGNRSKGQGCPYCAGKRVLTGFNDLQTLNPLLSSEWNYEKNGDLTPQGVTSNSNKKVWWKCPKNHEYQAVIGDRKKGNGCPFCAGKKVLRGFNDLKTLNPSLSSEWNYERNGELTPDKVTSKSNRRVWWKCSKGHEWQGTIWNRSNGWSKCPECR